jgi:hypothetical protein
MSDLSGSAVVSAASAGVPPADSFIPKLVAARNSRLFDLCKPAGKDSPVLGEMEWRQQRRKSALLKELFAPGFIRAIRTALRQRHPFSSIFLP